MASGPATRAEGEAVLRAALNVADATFRAGQWEAIDALVNRHERVLVVQRTGWGKSAVYFIATRLLRDRGSGPTVIVSPLLALMRDQIAAAKRIGIQALSLNSTNQSEWASLTNRLRENQADALLISPERLANDAFVEQVFLPIANRIGLVVVDEAHCISDWGHDFRPDYRRLINVLQSLPANLPVLGTTATANNRVVDDVTRQLGRVTVQRGPLMREGLALQTLVLPDQAARLAWLAHHVPQLPGTGIVYTLTVRDAEQVAAWLRLSGIEARAYHGNVESSDFADSNAYREHLEDLLLHNKIKVLVATTALGMGYDKPDLGFVVHYQAPGSIVAYYQQVGRAGRAIERSVGVLLAGTEDGEIVEYFRESAFPSESHVATVLDALAESDGLTVRQMEGAVNLRQTQIERALKFLSVENPSPVLKDGTRWMRTANPYALDQEHIARITGQRRVEWEEVQAYIQTSDCRMAFLARALDDEQSAPCGICDNCLGRPVVPTDFPHELAVEATRFLRQADQLLNCKKQVAAGAFPVYGFRGNLAAALQPEVGRILATWGDAGWGQVVRDDRQAGQFRDELAVALAEMIRERWQPEPAPEWVTCVPSLTQPTLMADFAQRVAAAIGLPFVPAVTKIKANSPQRNQRNRFHQCANLDGVFAIAPKVPSGPVLLLDDVVDSAWTMTVVSALLRKAGVSRVWPAVLAAMPGASS